MWTEIKYNDLAARQKEDLLAKWIAAQGEMNKYYKENFSLEYIKELLNRKRDLNARLFIYEDREYTITLATKYTTSGDFRLLTTSCPRYADIATACDIAQTKLIEIMKEHGKTNCFAVWEDNNYEKGNTYFWAFVNQAAKSFKISENKERAPGKYVLTMEIEGARK